MSIVETYNRSRGFTLIELMVVVAIIGLLSAIALPIYRDYIIRARASEAQALMAGARTVLEQYYQDNRRYGPGAAGSACGPAMPVSNEFTYGCVLTPVNGAADGGFVLTATAKGSSAASGFVYTIDQANVRKTLHVPLRWSNPSQNCWSIRKDGSCS